MIEKAKNKNKNKAKKKNKAKNTWSSVKEAAFFSDDI